MGVGEARLFLTLMNPAFLIRNTSTLTTSRPVSASKASTRSDTRRRRLGSLVGRRHPDAASRDDRRRPPRPGNARFPQHVLRLAPLERDAAFSRVPLTREAAELRPVFGAGRARGHTLAVSMARSVRTYRLVKTRYRG